MSKRTEDSIIAAAVIFALLLIFATFLFWPDIKGFISRVRTIDHFSCEKAESAAEKYLQEHHSGSDYEISSVYRDEKGVLYYVSITSPSSADRGFQLGYDRKGQLMHNSYESRVLQRGNVAIRLSNEYDTAWDSVFHSAFAAYDVSCAASLLWRTAPPHDDPHILYPGNLELDASYDLTEFGEKYGSVWVNVEVNSAEAVTVENLAKILLYLRETAEQAGLPFYMIDCYLDYPNGTYSRRLVVKDFLYEDIYEENLEARLEEALKP